jgi:hypothetical protein
VNLTVAIAVGIQFLKVSFETANPTDPDEIAAISRAIEMLAYRINPTSD